MGLASPIAIYLQENPAFRLVQTTYYYVALKLFDLTFAQCTRPGAMLSYLPAIGCMLFVAYFYAY